VRQVEAWHDRLMDDLERVLSAGLRSFSRAVERHRLDVQEVPNRTDPHLLEAAFGSLVECTFWAATLDTQLHERLGDDWARMRDGHEWGTEVLAMLWARDRHYHQFPFSAEPDLEPFLTNIPNAVFYISEGVIWKTAAELELGGSHPRPTWRAAFVSTAEGKGTMQPLSRAATVFNDLMPKAFELMRKAQA
jgi:hypothetical protein